MWVKVTSLLQIESLHPGSIIAIYPLQGAPADVFSEEDMDQVSHRLVSENDGQAKMLHTTSLQRKEESHTITSAGMGNMLLGTGDIGYAEIIEHGNWWIQQGY